MKNIISKSNENSLKFIKSILYKNTCCKSYTEQISNFDLAGWLSFKKSNRKMPSLFKFVKLFCILRNREEVPSEKLDSEI